MDQSFTADNFLKIYDSDNRKGIYLDDKYFPSVAEYTRSLKSISHEINELKRKRRLKNLNESEKLLLKNKLEEKERLRKLKRDELKKTFELMAIEYSSNDYKLEIRKHNKKPNVYITQDTAINYFILKQLSINIESLYKIKANNYNHIVSQVIQLLSDNFPKLIIRTDVRSFYENIDHDRLVRKLNDDGLLTPGSVRLIKAILDQYRIQANTTKGIPRGVGISSLLSEMYMREVDQKIKKLRNVIYSARYVDDIIVIFAGEHSEEDTLSQVKNILESNNLETNSEKTYVKNNPKPFEIDYLGYRLCKNSKNLEVKLTKRKLEKYKQKIDRVFSLYTLKQKYNPKKHATLLKLRLKYLTSNTRLINNKKNICAGIYFSNRFLNSESDLKALDSYLNDKVSKLMDDKIKSKLSNYSFVNGFNQKIFSRYTEKQLLLITKAWNDV